ncbi:MAG: cupin domain-containing protein [Bradyrhizobium sp.]
MSKELINADFSKRVVIKTDELPWIPSPQIGVERRMLDRIGGEVARATSVVRYAPASYFPAHSHGMGEEFLVLEGVFSDEHGDYPRGTYVRNPPGSSHTPHTAPGCMILVKLRQMSGDETDRVVVDTNTAPWVSDDVAGVVRISLFSAVDGETVAMEKLAPRTARSTYRVAGGEEIFILDGDLADARSIYKPGDWIRSPAGSIQDWRTNSGAVYWVKRGHLPPRGMD